MTVMTWLWVNIRSINLHDKSIFSICVTTEKLNKWAWGKLAAANQSCSVSSLKCLTQETGLFHFYIFIYLFWIGLRGTHCSNIIHFHPFLKGLITVLQTVQIRGGHSASFYKVMINLSCSCRYDSHMWNQVTAVPCKHYNDLNHKNDEWTNKMCRCVLSLGPVGVTLLGYVAEDANARHRRIQKRGGSN